MAAPAAPGDGKLLCRLYVPKRNLTKTVRLLLVRNRARAWRPPRRPR